MSGIARNTRLAVALVTVLLMIGAAAGRAMRIHHNHSVQVRALAVDCTCLICVLAPLAATVFVLPIPPARKLANPETFTLSFHESFPFSHLLTRPPPSFA